MTEIKPAMTAEEWDALEVMVREASFMAHDLGEDYTDEEMALVNAALAKLKALLLGFTWADVDRVRTDAYLNRKRGQEADAQAGLDLADRIAALLPPREP